MDSLDRAIISELEQDGRIPNVDLAARVGITPAPCFRRVRRLEQDGVIRGYRAVVAPEAVGRGFEVLADIELRSHDGATVQAFEAAMLDAEEVRELRGLFGSPDYFARVAVADLKEYETFLSTRLLHFPGIGRVLSRFTLKSSKG